MSESEKPKRFQDAVLDKLVATFPVFAEAKPLAIGIHKAILERLPELTKEQVSRALKIHTASTRYMKTMSKAETRFDLDGNPAGEITAEQREHADKIVKDRIAKSTEKRKAEEVRQREEAKAKKQQEKLLQLAAKFSKR